MKIKQFAPADYEQYASWWRETPPPPASLPLHGFVIGEHKCAGFLANTDTDFAIITWWHCNPANTPRESHEALRSLFIACQLQAKALGKRYVFLYTSKRAVIRILGSLGFIGIDHGHMASEVL
jgi:hypothetical protein